MNPRSSTPPELRRTVEEAGWGFSLIEVVVALGLLSLLLVPLFTAFLAVDAAADDAGADLARLGEASAHAGRGAWAWSWSSVGVDEAEWREDALLIRLRLSADAGPVEVGWWLDGWPVGATTLDPRTAGAEVVLPEVGGAPAGSEITVRAREADGSWGVPWRTIRVGVPAQPGPGEVGEHDPEGVVVPAIVVVHARAAGLSRLALVDGAQEVSASVHGCPVAFTAGGSLIRTECDGTTQAFRIGPGAVGHLYF